MLKFREYSLILKVLAGLEPPLDLSTKLFGHHVGLPFFTCPTAGKLILIKNLELMNLLINLLMSWEGEKLL